MQRDRKQHDERTNRGVFSSVFILEDGGFDDNDSPVSCLAVEGGFGDPRGFDRKSYNLSPALQTLPSLDAAPSANPLGDQSHELSKWLGVTVTAW